MRDREVSYIDTKVSYRDREVRIGYVIQRCNAIVELNTVDL